MSASVVAPENLRVPGSKSANDTAPRYRADIDGLRAIAVSAVVFFHAGLFPFASGYVGVDIFFVISGYLIGGIILRGTRADRFRFSVFYARRARRILPALVTVILVTCVIGWFLLSAAQFRDLGATATASLLAVSNVSFWRFNDYFAADARLTPLLMTWSLGVEEQFYIFFPILIFALRRWSPRNVLAVLVVATLASLSLSIWRTDAYPAAAFYLVHFRAWELGVGTILAFLELEGGAWRFRPVLQSAVVQQALGSVGFVLLVVSVVAFSATTPFPGIAAMVPVLGTAAVLLAERSWFNRGILAARPVVFVGTISYSWYLWHWPLMSYVRNVAYGEPSVVAMAGAVILSFVLAVLSWRFVEQPFRHGPLRVRRTLLGYAALMAACVAVTASIRITEGFPQRLPPQAGQTEAVRVAGLSRPCLASWADDKPRSDPSCSAERPGRPTVALIGDSHGAALSEGLQALAARQDWGYEIMAKSACSPLVGVTVWRHTEPEHAEICAAFMTAAFAKAVDDPNVAVVILAGMWPIPGAPVSGGQHLQATDPKNASADPRALFRAGLTNAVSRLVSAGKRVIIVGDTPRWRFDVGQVELNKAIPLRSTLARWVWSGAPRYFPERPGLDLIYKPFDGNRSLFKSLTREGSVTYVDLFGRFCSETECTYERDGKALFFDTGHLSALGSRYALQDVQLQ